MKINNASMATIYVIFVMFLPNSFNVINQPGIPLISYRRSFIFLWIAFYVVLLLNKKSIRNQLLEMPYNRSIIILSAILGIVACCTFINNAQSLPTYIAIISETIFPVFMVWTAFKVKDKLLYVIKTMVYVYILIAVYGIIAYIYNYNPLLDLLSSEDGPRTLTLTYDDRERAGVVGRAQSFFAHAMQFGYISSAILVFIFGVQRELKLFSIMEFLGICIILISAVMFTASRSPIILLISAAFVYVIHLNIINIFKVIAFSVIALSILIYSDLLEIIFGSYLQFITSIYDDILTGSSDLKGSSIDMRLMQLEAAMNIFWESPIYGHGFAYLRYLVENKLTYELLGAESFLFALLVETGGMGIIGYLILYKGIYSSFRKYLNYSRLKNIKVVAVTGIALLGGHLAFIFVTGEMGMTYIYLILTTLLLRLIYLLQVEKNSQIVKVKADSYFVDSNFNFVR